MNKNLLILNGKIAFSEEIRDAVLHFRTRGYGIDVRVTWEKGDAIRIAEQSIAYQRIIVGGGDGTLSEAVNGLMQIPQEQRPILALIPMGTANDFAIANNIPLYILDAFENALNKPAVKIDLIAINNQYCINMTTLGFGTQISANTSDNLKNIIGGAAYLFTGFNQLHNMRSFEVKITADNFFWSGNCHGLALGNSTQAGGGLVFCPNAQLDDACFELAIMPTIESDLQFEVVSNIILNGLDTLSEYAVFSKQKNVRIQLNTPVPMNIDGEALKTNTISARCFSKCLDIVLPN